MHSVLAHVSNSSEEWSQLEHCRRATILILQSGDKQTFNGEKIRIEVLNNGTTSKKFTAVVDLLNNTMVWSFASRFCKPLWITVPRVLILFIYF